MGIDVNTEVLTMLILVKQCAVFPRFTSYLHFGGGGRENNWSFVCSILSSCKTAFRPGLTALQTGF